MKTLWFKKRYVEAILQGDKRETIRSASSTKVRKGDVVHLSVGPTCPFAVVRIAEVVPVRLVDVEKERQTSIRDCLGARADDPLVRIRFRLMRKKKE